MTENAIWLSSSVVLVQVIRSSPIDGSNAAGRRRVRDRPPDVPGRSGTDLAPSESGERRSGVGRGCIRAVRGTRRGRRSARLSHAARPEAVPRGHRRRAALSRDTVDETKLEIELQDPTCDIAMRPCETMTTAQTNERVGDWGVRPMLAISSQSAPGSVDGHIRRSGFASAIRAPPHAGRGPLSRQPSMLRSAPLPL